MLAEVPDFVAGHLLRALILVTAGEHKLARGVRLPLLLAVQDYAQGCFAAAIEPLARVRDFAQRFGGSHALRDLITPTLIDAAVRAREQAHARHVLNERLYMKSAGAWGERLRCALAPANAPRTQRPLEVGWQGDARQRYRRASSLRAPATTPPAGTIQTRAKRHAAARNSGTSTAAMPTIRMMPRLSFTNGTLPNR